jgi:hypothetical protein
MKFRYYLYPESIRSHLSGDCSWYHTLTLKLIRRVIHDIPTADNIKMLDVAHYAGRSL